MGQVHGTADTISSGWQGRCRATPGNFSFGNRRRQTEEEFNDKANENNKVILHLKGKIAVVTGAGRGLGRQAALTLGAHGAAIVAVSRSVEQLRQTEQTIKRTGGVAHAMPMDISRPEGVEKLKSEVEKRFGFVSILANAAGIFGPIQLIKASDSKRW